jgi:hypothetical protein
MHKKIRTVKISSDQTKTEIITICTATKEATKKTIFRIGLLNSEFDILDSVNVKIILQATLIHTSPSMGCLKKERIIGNKGGHA